MKKHIRPTRPPIFVLAIALLLTSSYANSQDANTKIITLASIDNYIPYSYSEAGHKRGLYIDIIEELFSRTEYTPKIQLLPFRRLLPGAKNGDVDGIIGAFYTPERAEYATYLKDTPFAQIIQQIFVLRSGGIKSSKPDDIAGAIIAHKRGFIMSDELNDALEDNIFHGIEVETTQQLLLLQRVDGFIQEKPNANYFIAQLNEDHSVIPLSSPVSDKRLSYLTFSKKALVSLPGNFVETINTAFNSIIANGTFKKTNTKHGIDKSKT